LKMSETRFPIETDYDLAEEVKVAAVVSWLLVSILVAGIVFFVYMVVVLVNLIVVRM